MAKTTTHVDPRVRLAALCERTAQLIDYELPKLREELDALATEFGAPQADDQRVVELLAAERSSR